MSEQSNSAFQQVGYLVWKPSDPLFVKEFSTHNITQADRDAGFVSADCFVAQSSAPCDCVARFYGDDRNAHQGCCATTPARNTTE